MIGDGLHYEADGKWISKEYKRLSRILIPEIREAEKKGQIAKNEARNKRIAELLANFTCSCGGKCKHVKSGSLTVKCQCGKIYKARKTKNAPQKTAEAVVNSI